LHELRNGQDSDVDRLSRLPAFSWLLAPELKQLAGALSLSDFRRYETILDQTGLASNANILLRGVARITRLDVHDDRVTVALLAPGPIPEFPSLASNRPDFRCEAYNDCRVGSMSWGDLGRVLLNSSPMALKTFHENDLKQWFRLLMRGSSFLDLRLHERIAMTLLELCADFGVEDARGTLLRVSFSHKDIASLVGASRPRVTEHLAQFERENFLIRQGRQLVVLADKLNDWMNVRAA
jgi:CRP-like cAMP-binding protein